MFKIDIVLFQEAELWVAQGLQKDITGQGATIDDAIYDFQRALFSEILIDLEVEDGHFAAIPPAPHYYWEKWKVAGKFNPQILPTFSHKNSSKHQIAEPEIRIAA